MRTILLPFDLFTLGVVLLIAAGCDLGTGERISRLEKQIDELKAEAKKNSAAADFDLQAKCSRDAKGWFNDNWSRDKDAMLLIYSNHYNKAQNKCFILVEYHYSYDKSRSWLNEMSLWDVYENSKYGDFIEDHLTIVQPERDSVLTCELLDKKCKTLDEFNGLVQPYLIN